MNEKIDDVISCILDPFDCFVVISLSLSLGKIRVHDLSSCLARCSGCGSQARRANKPCMHAATCLHKSINNATDYFTLPSRRFNKNITRRRV